MKVLKYPKSSIYGCWIVSFMEKCGNASWVYIYDHWIVSVIENMWHSFSEYMCGIKFKSAIFIQVQYEPWPYLIFHCIILVSPTWSFLYKDVCVRYVTFTGLFHWIMYIWLSSIIYSSWYDRESYMICEYSSWCSRQIYMMFSTKDFC